MPDQYFELGVLLEKQNPDALTIDAARRACLAVQTRHCFTLVELRVITDADSYSEVVVVDCANDWVPSKNRVGIQYSERLGLRFFSDPDKPPETRALRKDFPPTPHQNHVRHGEPSSLCLYFEPWTAVVRSWTPQKHLSRILWWLAETANESLHRSDQPVEQLYFTSEYELVLPPDFETKIQEKNLSLVVEARPLASNGCRIIVGSFVPTSDALKRDDLPLSCIALSLPPVVHGPIERIPYFLGDLHDQLQARGAPVAPVLFDEIRRMAEGKGLPTSKKALTLLILNIPVTREVGVPPEKQQTKGFIAHGGLGELGVKSGTLVLHDGRYYQQTLLGAGGDQTLDWRNVTLEPVELLQTFVRKLARQAAGIKSAGPAGVLAGVGALGSAIASLWYREGWGSWTLIDSDHIKPHNLARHATFEFQVGRHKVHAVSDLERFIYPTEQPAGKAIVANACNFANSDVSDALDTAGLVVDATTTLELPRDLSIRNSVKRAASVFLTPSGLGSVLMIEDTARITRLDLLEAQYYRAVINRPWGDVHLAGNKGYLWVGAGCRDVSVVIPPDLVQIHAATLARQVRIRSERPAAAIQVWHCDPDTGLVATDQITPALPLVQDLGSLTLIWDEDLRVKVRQLRTERLPSETGGVLLGYFDLKSSRVYIVDVHPAPADSQGDHTGFTRGVAGLQGAVQDAGNRTGQIVSYIGEWHSHPANASANPSTADVYLLAHLANALHIDGLPALMLIVGEHEEHWLTGEATA